MELAAHGFDTVSPRWVLPALPVTDREWQVDMLGAGFVHSSRTVLEQGEMIESQNWTYQHAKNDTLRLSLRGGQYLAAEFSVPRWLDDSPINLSLASSEQVQQALEEVRSVALGLIPAAEEAELQKFQRIDYAADVAAGEAGVGVIAAGVHFRFAGARKVSSHIYPGESSFIRTPTQAFRCYGKGLELEEKLSPKQREQHATIIQMTKEQGLIRMEYSNRKRGGLATNIIYVGNLQLATKIEKGFPAGKVLVGGLHKLRADVDGLPISSRLKNTLIGFAVRYATLGEAGMKAAYPKATFHRQKKQFLEHGLCLDDVCSYEGEIDFRPIIRELKAA